MTRKGQATIPKEVREFLRLKPGDRVMFVRKGDEILLKPVRATLLDLRGSIPPKKQPENFDEVRAKVRAKRYGYK